MVFAEIAVVEKHFYIVCITICKGQKVNHIGRSCDKLLYEKVESVPN